MLKLFPFGGRLRRSPDVCSLISPGYLSDYKGLCAFGGC